MIRIRGANSLWIASHGWTNSLPRKDTMAISGGMLDARKFGAAGDGLADDTDSVQKALDAAAEDKGAAFLPPGIYKCRTLKMHPYTELQGHAPYGYRSPGGSIITPADAGDHCLIDLAGAIGCGIQGVCLEGNGLGDGMHGILLDKPDYGKEEDAFRIDQCKVSHFSGDGIHLGRVWCFTVRHSHLFANKGSGLVVRGWDGFVLDCWFSGNGGAGYGAFDENASNTLTANRVEWNAAGGIVVRGGTHYNVTGNYVDRCGAAGIALLERDAAPCTQFAMTGNVIYRSGKWSDPDSLEGAHARFEGAKGMTFVGNTLVAGRDDGGKGNWSPSYGIVCRGLENAVIKDNVMHNAALRELIVDQGEHGDGFIMKDNPGCLKVPE